MRGPEPVAACLHTGIRAAMLPPISRAARAAPRAQETTTMSVTLTIAHGFTADLEAVELHRAPSGKVTKWGLRAFIFEAGNDLAVATHDVAGFDFPSRGKALAFAADSQAVEAAVAAHLGELTAEREQAEAEAAALADANAQAMAPEQDGTVDPDAIPDAAAIEAAAQAAAAERAEKAAAKPRRSRRKYEGAPPLNHPLNEVMEQPWLDLRTQVRDAFFAGDKAKAAKLLVDAKLDGASWVAVEAIARSQALPGLNNALWVGYRAATAKAAA
jgi:hypothetical protein